MLEDMKDKYYEITVKNPHDGGELNIKTSWDADAHDWGQVFKTILHWCTFHPDTIEDLFHQEREDEVND